MEAPSNVEPIRFTLPFVEIASKISFRFRNVKKTFQNYASDSSTCRQVLLADKKREQTAQSPMRQGCVLARPRMKTSASNVHGPGVALAPVAASRWDDGQSVRSETEV